jgi:serine/threonine-protein kinase
MSLQVGREINGYELLDVISTSRTRVVYRVRNTAANRIELMHMMPRSLQDDQERAERFIRETRILATLRHPHIVRFFDAVVVDGQLAMTTELVEGVPLEERLQLGPLAINESLQIMREILSAVALAHEHGIVHREITPKNILIAPGGGSKLAGFTYAKSASDSDLTRVGAVLGDISYMPPEQVRGVFAADARSDLYSLGAVFFAMATGAPPFQSASQFDVMMAHVNTPPPRPSERNPEIPRHLDGVILKALAKQPEARYQTASEFRLALDLLDQGAPKRVPMAHQPSLPSNPASVQHPQAPFPQANHLPALQPPPYHPPAHHPPAHQPLAHHAPANDPAGASGGARPAGFAGDYLWPTVALVSMFLVIILSVLFAINRSNP